MTFRRGRRAFWRLSAGAGLWLVLGAATGARADTDCATRIAEVIAGIAARDLDTARGPPLNAFLALNPYAVTEASERDRRVAAGASPGALDCVPVAVKDNYATFDMPMTVGSLSLVGNQPPRDAAIVARLRAAGAIVVGKTNMDEFAFGISGVSGAGGRVGNAYDPARSSGGSSAGSGVAVGAGFVPLAVGSDNCGSLRIPAVYNGVVALRPTYGRFDSEGLFPIGFANSAPGLIARDIPMLAAGLAAIDPGWRPAQAAAPASLRGMRFGVLAAVGDAALGPTNTDAGMLLLRAVALLRSAGAEIVEGIRLEGFDATLGRRFVAGSAPRIDAVLSAYPAARRDWADVCSSGRIPPDWTASECLSMMAADRVGEAVAQSQIAANRSLIEAVLATKRLDGLVYLTDRRGSAGADQSDGYTCFVASTSGLPAIALPAGLDTAGMPVGIEILGGFGRDEALVAVAAALERSRGPLTEPPPVPWSARLAGLGIAGQNGLRLFIGWSAFKSRYGDALGDLAAERFRALTEQVVGRWTSLAPP